MSVVSDYTALLSGWTWNGSSKFNTPVIVSYSFETSAASYLANETGFSAQLIGSFSQFNENDKALARNALQQWSAVSGVRFVEAAAGTGDIRFSKLDFSLAWWASGYAGFAYNPVRTMTASGASENPIGGDVFVNTRYPDYLGLLLHEIGHALGLKHPFDGSTTLSPSLDNQSNTVMSYTGAPASTLGWLDIQAIQRLYGTTNPSTWSWNAATRELTQVGTNAADTIFGTGQQDIIRGGTGNDIVGGFSGNDYLDGGAGADVMYGGDGNDSYVVDNVKDVVSEDSNGVDTVLSSITYSIAQLSGVENLTLTGVANINGTGNGASNVIVGNGGDNILAGGLGTNTLDGSGGNNTAKFDGARSSYTIYADFSGAHVDGNGAKNTLNNIQQLTFSDGTVALAPLLTFTLESFGSTQLTQVINQFFLRTAAGAGPVLSLQGGAVRIGQFDAWKPIGAERVGAGYEVAWRNGNANQFRVWNTGLDGSYISSATDIVAGSDYGLQSLERSFQQDLNGDGRIGLAARTVEAFGATQLVEVGNQFFLQDAAGIGPALRYQGTAIVEGQFGSWNPIAVEKSADGYRVVFRAGVGATSQYSVWNVASNGNYVGSGSDVMAGTDPALQNLEPTFQQDLNGDGNIGLLPVTLEAFGATLLVEVGNQFFLRNAAGSGPLLKYQGTAVLDGQLDPWKPIATEKTAAGYQVVWKNAGANQYSVWNVASNGNFIGSATGILAAADTALQALEPTFQQDLNGDGRIGLPTKTIEAFGTTRLIEVGSQFFLRDSSGNGPVLKYQGAAVTEGQFAAWKPIAAETMTGGYRVVWKSATADQYKVWETDSDGNYTRNGLGVVSGANRSLKSLETTFRQDLNGDGQVGPAVTIESIGVTALVKDGNQFLLIDKATGSGPILKAREGEPIQDGTRGEWKPIGAEKEDDGDNYWLVWKYGTTDQYDVWLVGNDGHAIFSVTDVIPGSDPTGNSPSVDAWEGDLHQDLNGDGVIGLSHSVQSLAVSDLVLAAPQSAAVNLPNPSQLQLVTAISNGLVPAVDSLTSRTLIASDQHSLFG